MTSFAQYAVYGIIAVIVSVILNVISQLLPKKKSEPPLVFHWFPFIGSAITYGKDPPTFLLECRKKHGDIFTYVMFGSKTTVYLGTAGNEFILNGKLQDLVADEIYGPLCTPVFGSGIVYDCPNQRFMQQKKFVKFGLTQNALESHVRLIEKEVLDYIKATPSLKGTSGILDVPPAMGQITIFTAARTLQGAEVRSRLTTDFAKLYHDLDMGFQPINFLMPWLPLPQNRRRDIAQRTMRGLYMDIINERRKRGGFVEGKDEPDMLWNLMSCVYKDGEKIPDIEVAHMMITLLLGGQHSSSSASSWIVLRLAARPDIVEELYQEQARLGGLKGGGFRPLEHRDVDQGMPLMQNVVKETLRKHNSIHSILRKVKRPMEIPGTEFTLPPGRVVLASPAATHADERYFAKPDEWDPHRWDDRVEVETEEDVVDYGFGKVNKGTRSPYLPFGAGRHRCIGEGFAYVNLCTIIATLVRNFKLSTVDGKGAVPETDYGSLFTGPQRPAIVRWERRM